MSQRNPFFSRFVGCLIAMIIGTLWIHQVPAQSRKKMNELREKMVQEQVIGLGVKNKRVIQAMRTVRREKFVPSRYINRAYSDQSIAIGHEQTISSPFIVAYMTEQIDPQPEDKVLEIGTGSGYQAAVLSSLVKEVYTIEIVRPLSLKADRTLKQLGLRNVHTKIGDGYKGWKKHAPFNKIIVTCSPEKVPRPLIEQLAEGGKMVIPVGKRYQQTFYLMEKKNGKMVFKGLRPTFFVPMTGQAETNRKVQPDGGKPSVDNGGFEKLLDSKKIPTAWYYYRLGEVVESDEAPEGKQFIRFKNNRSGRASQILQGLPIDGLKVKTIEISLWVKVKDIRPGDTKRQLPLFGITFFTKNRRSISESIIGPWHIDSDWFKVKKRIKVPRHAKEAGLRVGMFGALGEFSIDDIQIKVVD